MHEYDVPWMDKSMKKKRHSHIEVERDALLDSLRVLAAAPLVPGRMSPRKKQLLAQLELVLYREKRKLVVSLGNFSTRIKAKGSWKTAAVLPYSILEVLTSLVESAEPGKPLTLEGVGEQLLIGKAKLPCTFENQERNAADVDRSEREFQRVSEDNTTIRGAGTTNGGAPMSVLDDLKKLRPTCFSIPPAQLFLVAFPELPNLLLRFNSHFVEFRIIHKPSAKIDEWFEYSTVWKRVSYPAIRELGIDGLFAYATEIAASHAVEHTQEPQS